MVLRQREAAEKKHLDIREAFILLNTRNYTNEARKLHQKLLLELPKISDRQLLDDFQRTLMLVDPDPLTTQQTNNLIWIYHWTVSNEIERREETTLKRAHKLAEEE
jgi:hypothetical protein